MCGNPRRQEPDRLLFSSTHTGRRSPVEQDEIRPSGSFSGRIFRGRVTRMWEGSVSLSEPQRATSKLPFKHQYEVISQAKFKLVRPIPTVARQFSRNILDLSSARFFALTAISDQKN